MFIYNNTEIVLVLLYFSFIIIIIIVNVLKMLVSFVSETTPSPARVVKASIQVHQETQDKVSAGS